MSLPTVQQALPGAYCFQRFRSTAFHFWLGSYGLLSILSSPGRTPTHRWLRLAVGYRRRQPSTSLIGELCSTLRCDQSSYA